MEEKGNQSDESRKSKKQTDMVTGSSEPTKKSRETDNSQRSEGSKGSKETTQGSDGPKAPEGPLRSPAPPHIQQQPTPPIRQYNPPSQDSCCNCNIMIILRIILSIYFIFLLFLNAIILLLNGGPLFDGIESIVYAGIGLAACIIFKPAILLVAVVYNVIHISFWTGLRILLMMENKAVEDFAIYLDLYHSLTSFDTKHNTLECVIAVCWNGFVAAMLFIMLIYTKRREKQENIA